MTLTYLKERIQSAYDTMRQIPVEVLEKDFRLAMIRNQLAIILSDLDDKAEECEKVVDAEFTPPRYDEIFYKGMQALNEEDGEVPEGYGGCGQCQDPEHITAEAEYYVRNKVLKGRTDL